MDTLRVLLTGGSGWLGQQLTYLLYSGEFSNKVDLHVTYLNNIPFWLPSNHTHKLQLDDPQAVNDLIRSLRPTVIIHTAALTSIMKCEVNSATTFQLNSPIALVNAINEYIPNSLLVYTSTDIVYNSKSVDTEADFPVIPTEELLRGHSNRTLYGESKLQFEREVLKLRQSIVLRLSNMIGPDFQYAAIGAPKFLQFLKNVAKKREFISFKNDEIRSFVCVKDVLAVMAKIIKCSILESRETAQQCLSQNNSGSSFSFNLCGSRVFNLGGGRGYNRLELANIVARALGIEMIVHTTDEVDINTAVVDDRVWHVKSVSSAIIDSGNTSHNLPPRNVAMDSSGTASAFGIEFTDVEEYIVLLLANDLTA
jgi:dTDP-4-dehydrorhamnose reductase